MSYVGRQELARAREAQALALLEAAAEAGERCPTNLELCCALSVDSLATPVDLLKRLQRRGLIQIERFQNDRVVTITATGRKTLPPLYPVAHWRDRRRASGGKSLAG